MAHFVCDVAEETALSNDYPISSFLCVEGNGTLISPLDQNPTSEFVVEAGHRYLIIYQAIVQSSDSAAAGIELLIDGNVESTSQVAASISDSPSMLNGTHLFYAYDQTRIQLAILYQNTQLTNNIRGLDFGIYSARVTILAVD